MKYILPPNLHLAVAYDRIRTVSKCIGCPKGIVKVGTMQISRYRQVLAKAEYHIVSVRPTVGSTFFCSPF